VADPEVGRVLLLEGAHLRAEDVAARGHDGGDPLGQRVVVRL
jgi:hypothetical protein